MAVGRLSVCLSVPLSACMSVALSLCLSLSLLGLHNLPLAVAIK